MSVTISRAAVLGLVALLALPVTDAFWRMPCPGRLVLERIDPIVAPGVVSGHVHTVSGGSGFGFTTSYEQQRASACSSCPIKQDLSAYWTPKLYWRNKDNTEFEDVPQAGEGNGNTGGMTVYYEQRPGPNNDPLKAFPEGFRMVAGNPFQRNYTDVQAAPGAAVSFVCLDYSGTSSQSQGMPNVNCPDGLRAQVYFPSCWDGVNLDSPDHSSHMAYPIGHYDNGYCPDSHPVHLISIFFEVIYQTNNFADRWWDPNQHPFVFAMGDTTGYGFHGDFVNGWDITALQDAVDNCNADSGTLQDCPVFADLYTNEECQACRLPPAIDEAVTGNLTALPGCNPVTSGPEFAPPPATCPVTPISSPQTYYTDETKSEGWEYVGCANDSTSARTFQGASTSSGSMTVETCIKYCEAAGFSLAGLEYASQCYCDNNYYAATDGPRYPLSGVMGECVQPCAGNSEQICGGPGALSVYKNCNGGACQNAEFASAGSSPSSGTSAAGSSSAPSSTAGSKASSSPSSAASPAASPTSNSAVNAGSSAPTSSTAAGATSSAVANAAGTSTAGGSTLTSVGYVIASSTASTTQSTTAASSAPTASSVGDSTSPANGGDDGQCVLVPVEVD